MGWWRRGRSVTEPPPSSQPPPPSAIPPPPHSSVPFFERAPSCVALVIVVVVVISFKFLLLVLLFFSVSFCFVMSCHPSLVWRGSPSCLSALPSTKGLKRRAPVGGRGPHRQGECRARGFSVRRQAERDKNCRRRCTLSGWEEGERERGLQLVLISQSRAAGKHISTFADGGGGGIWGGRGACACARVVRRRREGEKRRGKKYKGIRVHTPYLQPPYPPFFCYFLAPRVVVVVVAVSLKPFFSF